MDNNNNNKFNENNMIKIITFNLFIDMCKEKDLDISKV